MHLLRYLVVILVGSLAASSANAASTFEVFVYGVSDSYYGIFNAVAALSGGDSYRGLIKMVVLMMLFVMIGTTIWNKLPDFITWFLQLLIVFTFLVGPISTVTIVDKVNGTPPYTVSNVPTALALMTSITSQAGFWMTDKLEALLSVPSDIRVSQNGYRFGQRVLSNILGSEISDSALLSDLKTYFADCIVPEASRVPSTAVSIWGGSSDSWDEVWAAANPMLVTTMSVGNAMLTVSCYAAANSGEYGLDFVSYEQTLQNRVNMELERQQLVVAKQMYPELDPMIALTKYQGSGDLVTQSFVSSSTSAQAMLKQALFTNFWNGASGDVAAAYGSQKAQMAFATTQAQIQAIQQYRVQGNLARNTMPRFRNMIEMIIIVLFPFMVVYAIAAGDKAIGIIRGFFMGLVWVTLWPPLYAVSNYFGITHDSKTITNIFKPTDTFEFSAVTAPDAMLALAQADADSATIVLAITVIAGIIAKGFDFAASPLVSSMMSNMVSTGGSVGAANALGNDRIQGGATNEVGRQGAGFQYTDSSGVKLTYDGKGNLTNAGDLGRTLNVSGGLDVQAGRNAANAREAATSQGKAYAENTAAGLATADKFMRDNKNSVSVSDLQKHGVTATDEKNFQHVTDLARKVSNATGVDAKTVMEAGLGGNMGLFTAKIGNKDEKSTKLQDEIASTTKEQWGSAVKYASAASTERAAKNDNSASVTAAKEASASFSQGKEAQSRVEASLKTAQKYEEMQGETRKASMALNREGTLMYARFLQEELGPNGDVQTTLSRDKQGLQMSGHELDAMKRAEDRVISTLFDQKRQEMGLAGKIEDRTAAANIENRKNVAGPDAVAAASRDNQGQVVGQGNRAGVNAATGYGTVAAEVENEKGNVKKMTHGANREIDNKVKATETSATKLEGSVTKGTDITAGGVMANGLKHLVQTPQDVLKHEIYRVPESVPIIGGEKVTGYTVAGTALGVATGLVTGGASVPAQVVAGAGRFGVYASAVGAVGIAGEEIDKHKEDKTDPVKDARASAIQTLKPPQGNQPQQEMNVAGPDAVAAASRDNQGQGGLHPSKPKS